MARYEEMTLARPLTVGELLDKAGRDSWSMSDVRRHMSDEKKSYPTSNWAGRLERRLKKGLLPHSKFPLDEAAKYAHSVAWSAVCGAGLTCLVAWVLSWIPFTQKFFVILGFTSFWMMVSAMIACTVLRRVIHRKNKVVIRSPARWVTHELRLEDIGVNHPQSTRLHTLLPNITALMPGTTFEISKLVQEERVLDPVVWALPPNGERYPILVYGKDGESIAPP